MAKRYLDVETWYRIGADLNHDAAVDQLRKSVQLEPNNADALAELAYALAFAGHSDESLRHIERAMRLNPNFPTWYYKPAGTANLLTGNFELAAEQLRRPLKKDPFAYSGYWLISALGHLGKLDEARTLVSAFPPLKGERGGGNQFSIAYITPLKVPADMKRFLLGLDKAGIPKEPQPSG